MTTKNDDLIIVHLKPNQKWFHVMSELIEKPVSIGFITVVHEVHLNSVNVEGRTEVRMISSEKDVVEAFVSLGVFFV
jgi:translation initiation factor 2 alpha subunit (eIF-2alpha)